LAPCPARFGGAPSTEEIPPEGVVKHNNQVLGWEEAGAAERSDLREPLLTDLGIFWRLGRFWSDLESSFAINDL
jgi:hypothetical protein